MANYLKIKEIVTFCHSQAPPRFPPAVGTDTFAHASTPLMDPSAGPNAATPTPLLSEEVLEGLTRIQRPGRGGLTLDGRPGRIKVAMVPAVFLGYAGSNRLGAFKAAGSVEKGTLLATVQFKAALWTASFEVDPDRQDQGAGGASHHLALSSHGRGFRPDLFPPGGGPFLGPLALAVRVHISPLSVLASHP